MKDVLVLDNELEDTRIRLATERDFYPKVCFTSFLATTETKDKLMKVNRDEEKSDGLSELEANSASIYAFMREHS